MWSREFLKDRAKAVLRVSYWRAFLVSLIIVIVGGGDDSFNFNWNFGNNNSQNGSNSLLRQGAEMFPLVEVLLNYIIVVILIALVLRIFLGYIIEVGGRRYFVQSAQNNIDMKYLGYGFSKEKYLNIIGTMLWRSLLNFMWFLLLIIPGIVKAYAYRMVPYILADNPNIGYDRAIELSNKMTDGQKMDMWILDLSFIGWYLLGTLLLLVGVLFVRPYENATKAELYLELRKNALDSGICSYEELGL
jgi:uncharacterized membrane protein